MSKAVPICLSGHFNMFCQDVLLVKLNKNDKPASPLGELARRLNNDMYQWLSRTIPFVHCQKIIIHHKHLTTWLTILLLSKWQLFLHSLVSSFMVKASLFLVGQNMLQILWKWQMTCTHYLLNLPTKFIRILVFWTMKIDQKKAQLPLGIIQSLVE